MLKIRRLKIWEIVQTLGSQMNGVEYFTQTFNNKIFAR